MLDRVEVWRWENVDLFRTNTDGTDADDGDGDAVFEARLDSVAVAKHRAKNQPLQLPPLLLLLLSWTAVRVNKPGVEQRTTTRVRWDR